MANLKSTDLIVVGRGGTSYQTTFEDFKDSVFIDSPLGINDVLTENNVADPAQSLHFRITEGDIPPTRTVDTINFDGGSGLRLGGLVSYYHINTPFTVDTGSGDVSEFEYATRQMSTMEDAYFTTNSEGDVFTQVGLWGIRYRDKGTEVYLTQNNIQIRMKDKNDPNNYAFNIESEAFSGRSSIKADEFIGDGSKLTNLPTPDVDAYTKVESDANFIGQDISSLPELPTD